VFPCLRVYARLTLSLSDIWAVLFVFLILHFFDRSAFFQKKRRKRGIRTYFFGQWGGAKTKDMKNTGRMLWNKKTKYKKTKFEKTDSTMICP